jgi:DNA-binding transcriptional regulator YhcF (GntR family)
LYQGAGCSNSQIELLTGIPGPPLDQIAAEYRACASTTELVKLHDSASNTAGSPKPGDRLLAQIALTCHRKDFNAVEKANAFAALKAAKALNNKQLAELLSLSPGMVTQVLSILEQEPTVQRRIASGELSMTSAYALSQEKDPAKRRQLAEQATSKGLSRSAIRAAAKSKPTSTVVCRITDGRVTVTCERTLDATGLIELLTQTASAVRKAAKQGLDLPTIERVLADRAKLKPAGASA